jgi:hypothetical protein
MTTPLTWHDVLAEEKQQPYFINTLSTVALSVSPDRRFTRRRKMCSTPFATPN